MPTARRQSHLSRDGHAKRAAWFDTLELEQRLRRAEAEHRRARAAIEAEIRREHGGRLPENWNGGRRRDAA